MNKHVCSLCGDWNLCVLPHKESIDISNIGEVYSNNLEVIPAKVPGNLELDLYSAGKVEDLFFGTNPDRIRRYTEKLHCYYFRKFTIDSIPGDPVLCFDGLDCYADVFVNGIKVASFDNMLIKETCNIGNVLKIGENEIFIHIKPAIIEAQKYEYPFLVSAGRSSYEQLYVRKPAHMYGWDIVPRYISAGIWRPCYIEFDQEEGIVEYYLCPTKLEDNGSLQVEFQYITKCDIEGDTRIKVEGKCKDHTFCFDIPMIFPCGNKKKLKIENPKLWWPRGYGEQNMYDITLTLISDGKVIDVIEFSQGLRTVKLNFTQSMEGDNGEFVFIVNNKKVYAKGSNWVPADAFHSRDHERIPKILDVVEECNCNFLRCWGGNVYEDEEFYNICDKKGIMIWQDFCFACSKYPQDEEFFRRIKEETIQIVKRLRSHACLALWSGDNECDLRWNVWESIEIDPNRNELSRSLLAWVVEQYDPAKTYLPSSPYITPRIAQIGIRKGGLEVMPEWHHYLWGKNFYKNDKTFREKTKFVSEFGAMGAPSPESLKKYISPEKLWPYNEDNDEWIMHSTSAVPELRENLFRLGIFFDQIHLIFNEGAQDLADFSIKSQVVQAEQLKYFIEYCRMHKWAKTGIIWWNIMDGWPQFSDAVVDYYFDKKFAFYAIKAAQQDVCVMVTDDGDDLKICVANDTLKDANINYTLKDAQTGEILAKGTHLAKANTSEKIGNIAYSGKTRLISIEWDGDAAGDNHYLDITEQSNKISRNEFTGWLENAGLYEEWTRKIKKW